MAWLSRVNFISSDTLSFTDINNLGNDIRAWGDNVNGGGYTLSNVALSASSGTMATVTGGTGAASTLTIRSTSGTGTSDAIVFQTASQSERMRITTGGDVGIGTASPSWQTTVYGTGQNTAALTDAGSKSASLFVGSSNGATGSGGAVILGGVTSGGVTSQWAIKSIMTSTTASGTADLAFSTRAGTGDTSLTERMRILVNGNVGVGTSGPGWQTTVYGTGQNTAALTDAGSSSASLFVGSSNGATGSGGAVLLGGITANGVTSQWAIKSLMTTTTASGTADLAFATRAATGDTSLTERMRILVNGNVGIGTTNPSAKLDVVGNLLLSGQSTASQYINVGYGRSGNGFSYIDFVGDTTYSPGLRLIRGDAGANTQSSLQHRGTGDLQLFAYEAAPIVFYSSSAERMRITSTGNVGIGTASPAYQLQLSTDSAAKPTTNTWTIASDARLKTVLGDYEKGLDAICALRPVRYKYNGFGGMVADGKEHISIVAQEAQEVFPECIGTFQGKLHGDDEQETELLNYNGHAITFALINAIKELKAEIDILKARN